MTEDTQFEAQAERRPGANPLLLVVAAVVVAGALGWYFLGQPGTDGGAAPPPPTETGAASPATTTAATPAAAPAPLPTRPIARVGNALIPITSTTAAQRQAVAIAGKDDPFRAAQQAPKAIVVAPIKKPTVPASAPVVKEYFAKTILVLGIVDTPKGGYAILSYEGRNEIARPGDAIKSAIVKSVSVQTRTVTFSEDGEEITRALEVSQS